MGRQQQPSRRNRYSARSPKRSRARGFVLVFEIRSTGSFEIPPSRSLVFSSVVTADGKFSRIYTHAPREMEMKTERVRRERTLPSSWRRRQRRRRWLRDSTLSCCCWLRLTRARPLLLVRLPPLLRPTPACMSRCCCCAAAAADSQSKSENKDGNGVSGRPRSRSIL